MGDGQGGGRVGIMNGVPRDDGLVDSTGGCRECEGFEANKSCAVDELLKPFAFFLTAHFFML
jgi:hypothetical protein